MLTLFACTKSDTQTAGQPKLASKRTNIGDTIIAQHDQLTYTGLATYYYYEDASFTSFDTAWSSILIVTFIDTNFLQYKTVSAKYESYSYPKIRLDTFVSGLCTIGDTTYLGGGLRFKGKDSVFLERWSSSGCGKNANRGGTTIMERLKFSGKLTAWSHAH